LIVFFLPLLHRFVSDGARKCASGDHFTDSLFEFGFWRKIEGFFGTDYGRTPLRNGIKKLARYAIKACIFNSSAPIETLSVEVALLLSFQRRRKSKP